MSSFALRPPTRRWRLSIRRRRRRRASRRECVFSRPTGLWWCCFGFDGGQLLAVVFTVGSCGGGCTGKVSPFAPTVKVNQGLHAAPFCHFAREPVKVHGLVGMSIGDADSGAGWVSGLPWSRNHCSQLPTLRADHSAANSLSGPL